MDNGRRTTLGILLASLEERAFLHHAVSCELIPMILILLEHGADLEARDSQGDTPLLCAVENGDRTVVKLLLDMGANIETSDNQGNTPLLRATMREYEETLSILLDKGANTE